MKKKIILAIALAAVLALTFAVAVSAASVHNENTVDYDATVTLNDGTVCNLFDSDGNALIWYISETKNGQNVYSSVRADDGTRVTWKAESWDEVQSWDAKLEDGSTSIKSKIVVINLMDDDVIRNTGNATYLNKPMDKFKRLFEGMKNLEYCYLRLDTQQINTHSFSGCSNLKYINLENLTQLKRMAQNSHFSGCTSLFYGQVLDLTRTQLTEFEGSSTFSSVPFRGVKFPETMGKVGSDTAFNNCTNLEFISIGKKARFYGTPFSGCTSLEAIYYVGTSDELTATIGSSEVTATAKSYAEYKTLSDKSGMYLVYDYSRCEAFNQGVHNETTATNACVSVCNLCNDVIVKHTDGNTTVTITYSDYAQEGTKTTACNSNGCTHSVTEKADALFVNLGFSAAEIGEGAMSVNYKVNAQAISKYEEVMGVTVNYGVFAVMKDNIGNNDIFGADGSAAKGVIAADITGGGFDLFNLKIFGFTEEQKGITLAMGAYVGTTKGGATEYAYLQIAQPSSGKYFFASYNDVLALLPSDDKEAA